MFKRNGDGSLLLCSSSVYTRSYGRVADTSLLLSVES